MRMRAMAIGIGLSLLFAPAALAGTEYAHGTLGLGGWWYNPTGNTYSLGEYNRMSASAPDGAQVVVDEWDGVIWAQLDYTPPGYNGFVQSADYDPTYGWSGAQQFACFNDYKGSVEITDGYCEWYAN